MAIYDMKSTSSRVFANGSHPTITMNGDLVIVAGWSSTASSNLYYCVGNCYDTDIPTIGWGEQLTYDDGDQATISINDSGYAVSVHRSTTDSNNLFYRVGKIDKEKYIINWGESIKFNAGTDPFLSINEKVAVAVWSSTESTNLYYSIGTIDTDKLTIKWSSGVKYDAGLHPTVSINKENDVILGHASASSTNLYYQYGSVTADLTQLKLVHNNNYDKGDSNDLTITDGGVIWESHKSSNDDDAFYKRGTVTNDTITWDTLNYTVDRTTSIRISGLQTLSSQTQVGVSIRLIDGNIETVIQKITKTD
ncbi:hypothetical protein [Agrobacterium vitis]|uniref:Uncharacterized protein n=1 Tax=Agrobacterium vitis TaxID=373 RepID=A0A7K1RJH0_AGRVI|nr:hypothetical protein [Agrobacterium vitis]MVA58166.1 hypothetical protein [Agrobacterium vitis]